MTVQVEHADGTAGCVGRRVFLPDEIARPRHHPVLGLPTTLLVAEQPAFQAYLTPCYQSAEFVQATRGGNRRRRRREPLRYVPAASAPAPESRSFTDPRQHDEAELARRLERTEQRIHLTTAPVAARFFWGEWRRKMRHKPGLALRLAEELAHRGSSVEALYLAWHECGSDNAHVVLLYLDYLEARRRHDPGKDSA
jgi:hypothetical protein